MMIHDKFDLFLSLTLFDFLFIILTGINFDLSKLTKARGQYYNVSTDQYSYLLNVCDNVTNVRSCGHKPNPGVCQISKENNQ